MWESLSQFKNTYSLDTTTTEGLHMGSNPIATRPCLSFHFRVTNSPTRTPQPRSSSCMYCSVPFLAQFMNVAINTQKNEKPDPQSGCSMLQKMTRTTKCTLSKTLSARFKTHKHMCTDSDMLRNSTAHHNEQIRKGLKDLFWLGLWT